MPRDEVATEWQSIDEDNARCPRLAGTGADRGRRCRGGWLPGAPRTESAYSSYEPLPLTVTARHAAWNANLAVLAVLAAGEVTGSQLFPGEPDPAVAWRNQAMMWRSQLSNDEWLGLHETFALSRTWEGQRRQVRLWRGDGTFRAPDPDIYWTYNIPPGHPDRKGTVTFSWIGHSPRLER